MRDAISAIAYLAVIAAIIYGSTACQTLFEEWNEQVRKHNDAIEEWNEQVRKRNDAIDEWNQHLEDNNGRASSEAREKLNKALANWNLYLSEKHRQKAEDLMPEIKQEENR